MLTAMMKTDPTLYYSGERPMLDRSFYNPELDMSLAQSQLDYRSVNAIVDDKGEELTRPYSQHYESGRLYEFIPNEYANYEKYHMYFIDDTPFETTLQIVGGSGNVKIAQDLFPDESLYFGCSPHYLIYPSDALRIIMTRDLSAGKFSGRFTFKKRGQSIGLALA